MRGIDWPGLIRAGLHGLRLHPRDFWALTPAELQIMLGDDRVAPPMGRADFDALCGAYPDQVKDEEDG